MKSRILLIVATLLSTFALHAQSKRVQGKQLQIAPGANYVFMSDGGNNGDWRLSPFFEKADTASIVATQFDLSVVDGRTIANGSFSGGTLTLTKQNGNTVNISMDGRYPLLSSVGQPSGLVPLGADGKVSQAYLPAQSISDVFVVSSEAAMLALSTATQGDYAKRTDVQKMYILKALPASTLANWEVFYDNNTGVQSVNGKTGNIVTLLTDDISEGALNKFYTDARARAAFVGVGAISVNNTTGQISLNNTGITPGTYNTVVLGADGRATAATNTAYLTAVDLNNYYTKTQLLSPGQAQVAWANIDGVPDNLGINLVTPEFTGTTSNVITLPYTPVMGENTPVYYNGVRLHDADYSVSGTTVTLGINRAASDVIKVDLWYRP